MIYPGYGNYGSTGGNSCQNNGERIDLRLAPMAAVTNAPFRIVARECGAGRLTSEELDARAVVHGNEKTWELARFFPDERPI